MRAPWLFALSLVAGCAGAEEDVPDEIVDDKGDRGGADQGFREVDPSHSTVTFRRYVSRAITMLERDDSQIARLTARSIRDGRVLIDELADLTCADRARALEEISGTDLEAELDGYMWSNRIYVSRGQTTANLAATLVHEVNHVINRSEVGYWDDLPTSAFLHEYRAFHAESMFDEERYDGVDLVAHVIELYELDGDAIPAEILADPVTPLLLPDAAAWRERRVEDDPVDDPAHCLTP